MEIIKFEPKVVKDNDMGNHTKEVFNFLNENSEKTKAILAITVDDKNQPRIHFSNMSNMEMLWFAKQIEVYALNA